MLGTSLAGPAAAWVLTMHAAASSSALTADQQRPASAPDPAALSTHLPQPHYISDKHGREFPPMVQLWDPAAGRACTLADLATSLKEVGPSATSPLHAGFLNTRTEFPDRIWSVS